MIVIMYINTAAETHVGNSIANSDDFVSFQYKRSTQSLRTN
jgi:dTDP-D-glucose 4,6-dehydratase